MTEERFDVIVIGSGGGMKIARPAAQRGLKTALIERDALGGTCLNRGCIPSKMLIYPADLVHLMRRAPQLNLKGGEALCADWPALIDRVSSTVDEMSLSQERELNAMPNLTFIRGTARFTGERKLEVNGRTMIADRIFIASGSEPAIPEIEGLEGVPYMTSREALRRRALPRKMIIIGAGYIACELGHVYRAFGTETHFVVRSKVLRTAEPDVRKAFESAFAKDHQLHEGWNAQRVSHASGIFSVSMKSLAAEEKILEADALLIAAGVKPSTADLNLSAAGVRADGRGYILVNEYLETDAPGIYALGDCVGNYLFRHSVNLEGEYLVRTLWGGTARRPIDYGPMPHAVFTHPEIAGLGAMEEGLLETGVDYVIGRAEYRDSNQGLARGLDEGFCKLLVARTDRRVLGAHIIGDEASNMIHMLAAVMYRRGTLDDLLDMVYIHPALPEIVRDAARDARDRLG
ncbi:MAG: dihydrolipoyl dehydrogenase [Kiritimatiellae bacterium]|nr:dihydrolipoyl dehydrogenase [Kiritimatiellia bacterium]